MTQMEMDSGFRKSAGQQERQGNQIHTVTEDEEFQKYNVEVLCNMDDGMVIINTGINDPCP